MANQKRTETAVSELKAKLHSETAKIPWRELQRFFAQGKVMHVTSGQDLVEVAVGFASDDKKVVQSFIDAGLDLVTDQQAKAWIDSDETVWSVVVAPFILVQEVKNDSSMEAHK